MSNAFFAVQLTDAQTKEVVTSGWQKILAKDPTFKSFFNNRDGAYDFGKNVVVGMSPSGDVNFQRQILWGPAPNGADSETIAAPGADQGNRFLRTFSWILRPTTGFRPYTQEPDDGPYGRVAETFGPPGKKPNLDAISTLLAINLYHELLHARFRMQESSDWPPADRGYNAFIKAWRAPADANFRKLRAVMDKGFGDHQVDKWLEEKLCIDQSFGAFGFPVFNEEIAEKYAPAAFGSKEKIRDLFDAIDKAHGVATVGLPASVPIKQFLKSFRTHRTKDNSRLNEDGRAIAPDKPPSPEDWDKAWTLAHSPKAWGGFVTTPITGGGHPVGPGNDAAVKATGSGKGKGDASKDEAVTPPTPAVNGPVPSDGGARKMDQPVGPMPPSTPHSFWSPSNLFGPKMPSAIESIFRTPSFGNGPPALPAAFHPANPSPIWRPSTPSTVNIPTNRPSDPGPILGSGSREPEFTYRPPEPPPIPESASTGWGPLSTGGRGWDDFTSGGGFFGNSPKVDEPPQVPKIETPEPPPFESPVYRPPEPPPLPEPDPTIMSPHINPPPYDPMDSFGPPTHPMGPSTGGFPYPED